MGNAWQWMNKGLRTILVINLAIFMFTFVFRQLGIIGPALLISEWFSLRMSSGNYLEIWRIVTYMFTHIDGFHFLINMYVLWAFGQEIAGIMGTWRFVYFYVGCGIFAGLISFPFYTGGIIGASGANLALLYAYAKYFPDRKVLLYFVIPVPVKFLVWILLAFDLYYLTSRGHLSGIAHLTHIAGLLAAFLLFRFRPQWVFSHWAPHLDSPLETWRRFRHRKRFKLQQGGSFVTSSKVDLEEVNPERIEKENMDRVLVKISRYGIESLTTQERGFLAEYSEKQKLRKS
jgi:membrane associated rhomboid family serine protease